MSQVELFQKILVERPIGTEGNKKVLDLLEEEFKNRNCQIISLPFSCKVWEHEVSFIECGGKKTAIEVSPFSEAFTGEGIVKIAESLEELKALECKDCILVLKNELTQSALQPKDYPFYYPDEHRELITLLEEKAPAAIIAVTGADFMSGLDPFPLFDDGNFLIPSAYLSNEVWESVWQEVENTKVSVHILSKKKEVESKQLVACKRALQSKGKIVICAHMDTKYEALGAIDNGTGVMALLDMANTISAEHYDIEIVPFNGEESYEASGELAYLNYLSEQDTPVKLVINIDSPCHAGSEIAVSAYQLEEACQKQVERIIEETDKVCLGDEWYAGDHAMFAFQGIPCIAISSSDLFTGALEYTHTMKDVASTVDLGLVSSATEFVEKLIGYMDKSVC